MYDFWVKNKRVLADFKEVKLTRALPIVRMRHAAGSDVVCVCECVGVCECF